jgi:hypothetical protein
MLFFETKQTVFQGRLMMERFAYVKWVLAFAVLLLFSGQNSFVLAADDMMKKETGTMTQEKMESGNSMKKEGSMTKEEDSMKKDSGMTKKEDSMQKEDTMKKDGGMTKEKKM